MLESGENYLETILRLTQKNGNVRSVDVAEALGVTKPSVSRAMSILREQGYVLFAESNRLVLTEKGRGRVRTPPRHLPIPDADAGCGRSAGGERRLPL